MKKQHFILLFANLFGVLTNAQKLPPIPENNATRPVLYTAFVDKNTIAFSGLDGNIYLLNLLQCNNPVPITGLTGVPDAFAVSSDGKYMAASSVEGDFKSLDLSSKKAKAKALDFLPDYFTNKVVCMTPDGSKMGMTQNCDVWLWNVKNGQLEDSVLAMDGECINAMVFGPRGDKAYCGGNNKVWIYSHVRDRLEKRIELPELNGVTAMAINTAGDMVAVGGKSGIVVMDAELKVKFRLEGHQDWVNAVTFSPDGRLLYSCSGTIFGTDNTVRVWDLSTGKEIVALLGHNDDVLSMSVSPSGKYVVTASRDQTIRVWNMRSYESIAVIIPFHEKNAADVFYISSKGLYCGSEDFFKMSGQKKPSNLESLTLDSPELRKQVAEQLDFINQ